MIESAFVSRLVRAAALAAAICGVSTAGPARADFEIEEPEVEQGEIELEYRGAYFWGRPALAMTPPAVMSDNNDDDDDGGAAERESDEGPPRLENEVVRHGHEFEFKAGVTDRWALEIEAEFEEERGEDGGYNAFKLTEVGLASKIELIPLDDGENGVGATLFVGYEKSVVSSENEKGLWVGPLLKGTKGPRIGDGEPLCRKRLRRKRD